MFSRMMNWCLTEPSRKLLVLTFVLGITSVLLALTFATLVVGAASSSLGDSGIPLSTLFLMGQASQLLFKAGPLLLMFSLGISVSRKIPFLNRRKHRAAKPKESTTISTGESLPESTSAKKP